MVILDIKSKLINDCKLVAEKLLLEFGEFYPFAFGVIPERITFVDVETEFKENPKVQEEIKELEQIFLHLDQYNQFLSVCICINVTVTDHISNKKTDALEIRVDFFYEKSVCIYIPYELNHGKVRFRKGYEEQGSFNFFERINQEKVLLNMEVYTLKSIFNESRPILYVIHDSDDRWQFLSGLDASVDDLTMVPLSTILEHDSSIMEILRMKKGSDAHRNEDGVWMINNDFSY